MKMLGTRLFPAIAIACGLAAVMGPGVGAAAPATGPAKAGHYVQDLDGKLVDPFQASADASAVVLVFVSADCPISNRYAPDIQKLHAAFGAKGVSFWLIYPNSHDTPSAIRAHLKAFNYPLRALRDPKHQLADFAKVTITPEAAVYDAKGALAYHGRIDDRYQSIGVERQVPTRRDLQDTLLAVLSGKPVPSSTEQAVGCYIADFVPVVKE